MLGAVIRDDDESPAKEISCLRGRKLVVADLDFLAVHGLAVRKAAGPVAVAALLGAEETEVSEALERAAGVGRVVHARGTFMLTPAGQDWLREVYPQVFAEARGDGALLEAYERFEKVNTELLSLMTDWQTLPAGDRRVANDHSDPDYDAKIIDRLGALHERADRVLRRAVAADPRFQLYLDRLELAYDRVLAGEIDYVSGVRIDSYHTVWFELHEDLLRTLDRTRQE